MILVSVVYATPQQQVCLKIMVEPPCTVLQAIEMSGILAQFPEINLTQQKIGIFSKLVSLDHCVAAGDRIEIYRPLLIDPKTARRQRARPNPRINK